MENIIKNLKKYLLEYKNYANEEIEKHPETIKYYKFCQTFFTNEQIDSARWEDFQEIGNNLNCYVGMALAKGNAFGHPNHEIKHYIDVFKFLLNEDIPLEQRVESFINDPKYKIDYITNGKFEIIGYRFPDNYIIKNSVSDIALKVLGYKEKLDFIDFNNFLNNEIKIQKLYSDIVGKRTKYPINIEIDRFLFWLATETDEGKQLSGKKNKIWIFAAGEKTKSWNEFYNAGIMAIGWDNVGNLENYKTKKELQEKVKELNLSDSDFKNRVKALWDIYKNISEGDIVYVKKGNKSVVGYGIVSSKYKYDETRDIYRHCRQVVWKSNKECEDVTENDFPPKALTEITNNLNLCQKLESLYSSTPKLQIYKNLILYGPPGTGKTYNTVVEAIKILDKGLYLEYEKSEKGCDDYKKLKDRFDVLKNEEKRIEFITFHQSYSYEEFVEGIKPDLDNSDVKYQLKDGVFKKISNDALFERIDISGNKKDLFYNFKQLKENFIKEYSIGTILTTDSKNTEFMIDKYTPKSIRITPVNGSNTYSITYKYLEEALNNDIKNKEDFSKINGVAISLISYYYAIYNLLKDLKNRSKRVSLSDYMLNSTISEEDKIQIIEDFYNNKLNLKKQKETEPYVLIIDEINRGNISKIFGELITLIEEDKRGKLKVRLPYSQDEFTVPENLYIIGTMNTSDRSIASVDIALRRRFKFKEMMPNPELVADFECSEKLGKSFKDMFKILNKKITILADRDHQIGHSYFIKDKHNGEGITGLQTIWFDSVLPLLNEYFYGDWEKLQEILGKAEEEDKKIDDGKYTSFIKKISLKGLNLNSSSYDEQNDCFDFVREDEINFEEALKNAFSKKKDDNKNNSPETGADTEQEK